VRHTLEVSLVLVLGPNHFNTPEFDLQCSEKARERALSSDDDGIWPSSDTVSSANTAPHEVSKVGAHSYHAGVSPRGRWPKLIYGTSSDIFEVHTLGPRGVQAAHEGCCRSR
jgi:hypothetical protein